jgi:leucyl-tRNA synthetase
LVLMAPAAPHITEELWQLSGHTGSIHQQPWPTWDENMARDESIEVAVQVDGKVRVVITIQADTDQVEVEQQALASPKIRPFLAGREVTKVIYVPGRVLNIVTRPLKS